jgi:serine/threonine protein kinase/tetratricopeptide (TPR) repeat protein
MADLSGQTLGRYQVIQRLGRGGMADVYRAYQPGLDRYVAIKVMHAHLAEDSDFITRFRREAKSVAGLRHPNIVQVFDFDVQGDVYYMVMEYIESGRTLKDVLTELSSRGERLSLSTSLSIMAKMADALDYAHKEGMIHRDIKPSNVLLTGADNPILSDFGIARLIDSTGLTSSGAILGTPAYMSPEQGRGEKADERSDLYALGIVLYEMLTGRPPYDADTPYAIILKHINDPVISPRQFQPGLPSAVERAALKSIAKSPEDRFQTGGDMRDALLAAMRSDSDTQEESTPAALITPSSAPRILASETQNIDLPDSPETMAVAPSTTAAAEKRSGMPAWLPIAGILGGVVLLGIIGAVVLGGALLRKGGDDIETNGVTEEAAIVGTNEAPAEMTDDAPAGSEGGEPGNAEIQPILDEAYTQWDNGYPEEAYNLFGEVLKIDPDNIEGLVSQALIAIDQGELEQGKDLMDQAAGVDAENPYVLFGMGILHSRGETYYDVETAESELIQAGESCDNNYLCANIYWELARIQAWYIYHYDDAIESITTAIDYEPSESTRYYYVTERANMYYLGLGDVEPALADLEEAYSVRKEAWMYEHAADFAAREGQLERAHGYYEQNIFDNPGDSRLLVGRGTIEWLQKDYDTALASADTALERDPAMLGAHYLRGLVLIDQDQPDEALSELEIVHEASYDEFADYWLYGFPFYTQEWGRDLHLDLARAASDAGEYNTALDYLEEIIGGGIYWAAPYMLKGDILVEMGDYAAAREAYLAGIDNTDDAEAQDELRQRIADIPE